MERKVVEDIFMPTLSKSDHVYNFVWTEQAKTNQKASLQIIR